MDIPPLVVLIKKDAFCLEISKTEKMGDFRLEMSPMAALYDITNFIVVWECKSTCLNVKLARVERYKNALRHKAEKVFCRYVLRTLERRGEERDSP
jgi:hypothetical protein